jgi:hypothetical protein
VQHPAEKCYFWGLPERMLSRIALLPAFMMFLLTGGCNQSELSRLQIENDSLRNELNSDYRVMASVKEIKGLLDSIDLSRNVLINDLREGSSPEDFSARLADINHFVKMSEEKVGVMQDALRSSSKESSGYLMLVGTLKDEIQHRLDDILKLDEQMSDYRLENDSLKQGIKTWDSEAEAVNRDLQLKQQALSLLETKVQAMLKNFKAAEADACYARAGTLADAARRTKLAPHKRRDTYREALELYKKALFLGKKEARKEIVELEKKLD